jgi:LPXTG-site transpeptidase (sortase) family protein
MQDSIRALDSGASTHIRRLRALDRSPTAAHDRAVEIRFPRRPAVFRRALGALAAILLVGTFAAATPASSDGSSYVGVSSLAHAVRADRVVISRVGINVPIRDGVLGAPIYEHVAYKYPGTSWPGGHSNIYLYGHARTGTFLTLKDMRVGDIVQVHLVTGAWVRYRVTIVRRVRWNDGSWTLLTSTERLTLQTCTSYYPTADKLVVVAVPVA